MFVVFFYPYAWHACVCCTAGVKTQKPEFSAEGNSGFVFCLHLLGRYYVVSECFWREPHPSASILLHFLQHVHDDRKMVGISVEPLASGMCALRISFVFSFCLEEIVTAENLVLEVFQR